MPASQDRELEERVRDLERQVAVLLERDKNRSCGEHNGRLASMDRDFAEHMAYAKSFEQDVRDDRTRVRVEIDRAVKALEKDIKDLKEETCSSLTEFVKASEFKPVRSIVYGLVGLILTAVVVTWLVAIGLKVS